MGKFIAVAVFGGLFQWAWLAAVHALGGPWALVLVCVAVSLLSALGWRRSNHAFSLWLVAYSGLWATAAAVVVLQPLWSVAAGVLIHTLQTVVLEVEPKARPP